MQRENDTQNIKFDKEVLDRNASGSSCHDVGGGALLCRHREVIIGISKKSLYLCGLAAIK